MTIDVPSGRVVARVRTGAGQVTGVDFVNVPSYALAAGIETQTRRGRVSAAIYAHLRAADVGLAVEPGNVNELIAIGREVKWALNETKYAQHPRDPRLNGIYGTILFDELGETCDGDLHQRSVTIFADGQLDDVWRAHEREQDDPDRRIQPSPTSFYAGPWPRPVRQDAAGWHG